MSERDGHMAVQTRADGRPVASGVTGASVPLLVTKAEGMYVEIRWRILKGVLAPGATINQESLAAELGVSVTPLREALRRLEAEKLIRLEAHRTVTIAPLSRRELDEIYVIRMELDPLAAGLAARLATDEARREVSRLAHEPWVDDPIRQLAMNRAYHRAIYSAGGNDALTATLDGFWDRTDRYRLLLVAGGLDGAASTRDHCLIAEAFESADEPAVRRILKRHLRRSRDLIVELAEFHDA